MLLVFSTVATALQDSGFVIALTNKRDATHDDYNAVFWFNIMVSIIAYVILFSVSPWIAAFYNEPILTSLSRYFFIGFFIASFSIVPRAILFRRLQQRELALMALSSLLISGAVGITLAAETSPWILLQDAVYIHLQQHQQQHLLTPSGSSVQQD